VLLVHEYDVLAVFIEVPFPQISRSASFCVGHTFLEIFTVSRRYTLEQSHVRGLIASDFPLQFPVFIRLDLSRYQSEIGKIRTLAVLAKGCDSRVVL
jgi:hypothetical protein